MSILTRKMFVHSKISRILLYFFGGILIILLALEISLRNLSEKESTRLRLENFLSQKLNATVSISKMGLSFGALHLQDVKIIDGNETFLEANKISARFNLLKLIFLKLDVKSIILDGLTLNLVKDENGVFNFEKLFPPASAVQQDSKTDLVDTLENPPSLFIDPYIKTVQIRNVEVNYLDKTNNMLVGVKDTFLDIHNFNLKDSFRVSLNLVLFAKSKDINIEALPLGFTILVDLKDMALKSASAKMRTLVFSRGGTSFSITSTLNDFAAPQIIATLEAKNISPKFFDGLLITPDFEVPFLEMNTALSIDFRENILKLSSLKFFTASSTITVTGQCSYTKDLKYDADISAYLNLYSLGTLSPLLSQFSPSGTIITEISLNEDTLSGILSLQDIGAMSPYFGVVKEVNGKLKINSYTAYDLPSLTANLNGHQLNLNASYNQTKDAAGANLTVRAKKFIVIMDKNKIVNKQKEDKATKIQKNDDEGTPSLSLRDYLQKYWKMPPLTLNLSVQIDTVETTLFSGKNLNFETNLTNISPTLEDTKGYIKFLSSDGEIKDIYTLTQSNALTRAMFMSLNIVSKVFNTLNVLEVLNTIGGIFQSSQASEMPKQNVDGKLPFDNIHIYLNFKDGLSEFTRGLFVSDMFSFKISGGINFKTQSLDMTVNAAPGNHPQDGFLPITVKIAGTIDEPQGSMSMLGSAASLVQGALLNNPASSIIKKGLFGMFGKKVEDNPDGTQPDLDLNVLTEENQNLESNQNATPVME